MEEGEVGEVSELSGGGGEGGRERIRKRLAAEVRWSACERGARDGARWWTKGDGRRQRRADALLPAATASARSCSERQKAGVSWQERARLDEGSGGQAGKGLRAGRNAPQPQRTAVRRWGRAVWR